jgi:hypothetical protein
MPASYIDVGHKIQQAMVTSSTAAKSSFFNNTFIFG